MALNAFRVGLVECLLCAFLFFFALSASGSDSSVIDIDSFAPGEYKTVFWLGYPVQIYKFTENQYEETEKIQLSRLQDAFDEMAFLSIRDFWKTGDQALKTLLFHQANTTSGRLVRTENPHVIALITLSQVRGCALSLKKDEKSWKWVNPCDSDEYDLGGRVLKNAKGYWKNLFVPKHHFVGGKLVLETDASQLLPIHFSPQFTAINSYSIELVVAAVKWRDWVYVEKAFDQGISLGAVAETQTMPYFECLAYAPLPLVTKLLKTKSSVDVASPTKRTPLLMAVALDEVERVKLLLSYGANPDGLANSSSNDAPTSLHALTDIRPNKNAREILKILLSAGANGQLVYQNKTACQKAKELTSDSDLALVQDLCD